MASSKGYIIKHLTLYFILFDIMILFDLQSPKISDSGEDEEIDDKEKVQLHR